MDSARTVNIILEGNLSSGKTTLLEKIHEQVKVMNLEHQFEIFTEPIGVWTNFGTDKTNLLDLMYHSPSCNSFEFQVVALMSKAHQLEMKKPINIVERSISAQRHVFIPVLLENRAITKLQEEILLYAFDFMEKLESQKIDLIVYVQCPIEVGMSRLMLRNRVEENKVDLKYLGQIHEKYENWLCNKENKESTPVIFVNSSAPISEKFVQGLIRLFLSLGSGGIAAPLLQK